MWDAVMEQEINACHHKAVPGKEVLLLKSMPAVQADGVTETKQVFN
jgi:hypothetical protein